MIPTFSNDTISELLRLNGVAFNKEGLENSSNYNFIKS